MAAVVACRFGRVATPDGSRGFQAPDSCFPFITVAERRLKFNPTNNVRRMPHHGEPETPGILPETFLPDDVRVGFECMR